MLSKKHGSKIPRKLRGSLGARVCGWITDYPKDKADDNVLGLMCNAVPGFPHPHICGKVLTSEQDNEVFLSYSLPDKKMFVHLKYLCPHHLMSYHAAVKKKIGLTDFWKKEAISDLSGDDDVCPKTGDDLRTPRPSKSSAALQCFNESRKKNEKALVLAEKRKSIEDAVVTMAGKGEARGKVSKSKTTQRKKTFKKVGKPKPAKQKKIEEDEESDDSSDSNFFSASSKNSTPKKKQPKREEDYIEIPVCQQHLKPTAFQCCFVDSNNVTCRKAICSTCFLERPSIFQRLNHINGSENLRKVSNILCGQHFQYEATALFKKAGLLDGSIAMA